MEIERQYLEWCEEEAVVDEPNSFVVFLMLKGWLNEEKIIEDLEGYKDESQTEDDKKHCVFCKWVYEPNVCGRCRNMNLFANAIEDEPQTKRPTRCSECKVWHRCFKEKPAYNMIKSRCPIDES